MLLKNYFDRVLIIKAIEGVSHGFYKLILFSRVFTKLQDAFFCFKKSESLFDIWLVKTRPHNRFLIEKEN